MANKHNNIFFTGTVFVISTILSRTEGMDSFSNFHNFVNNWKSKNDMPILFYSIIFWYIIIIIIYIINIYT